jgi:hypothetical protein
MINKQIAQKVAQLHKKRTGYKNQIGATEKVTELLLPDILEVLRIDALSMHISDKEPTFEVIILKKE